MSETFTKRRLPGKHRNVAEVEQQLLALGPLPSRDDQTWDADQWARYADLVCELSTRLSSPGMDQTDYGYSECAHCV